MDFLLNLLAAPTTLSPLVMQEGRKSLMEQNAVSPRTFPVLEEVPDFLAYQVPIVANIEDGPHGEKRFDYLDHYAKDADFFDYFAVPEDPATQHENQRLHETIFNELPEASSVVLDLGCGGAWFARKALPLGHKVGAVYRKYVRPLQKQGRYEGDQCRYPVDQFV